MKIGLLFGLIGLTTAAVICGSAIALGGERERRAGVVVGLAWAGSLAIQQLGSRLDPNLAFTVVDLAALLALAGLAWRPNQVWPMFALMFQALGAAIDCVRLIAPAMHRWAYLTGLAVAAYGLLASLAWGTVQSVRNRRAMAR